MRKPAMLGAPFDRFDTVREAARWLGVPETVVHGWLKAGKPSAMGAIAAQHKAECERLVRDNANLRVRLLVMEALL